MWELDAPNRAEFVVVILFLPIATLATALRLFATHKGNRKPGLEDWFAVGAWAALVVHDAAVLISLKITGDKDPETIAFTDPGAFESGRKWTLVAFILYITQQWLAKLSVAALYLRIFGVHSTYRRTIHALAALQTAWFFIPVFIQVFQCNPVEKFWMPFLEGECINQGTIIAILESGNSFTDFGFVVLAMFMIRSLNISSVNKARLGVLFGLGSLAGILGVVKVVVTYRGSAFYSFALVGLLSNVQMVVGIVCCCMPVLKSLLPKQGLWSRVSSSLLKRTNRRSTYHTGESASHPSTNPRTDGSGKRGQGWQNIYEDNSSTQGLSWDEHTHHFETHALSNMAGDATHPMGPGIQVERQVDVDRRV